MGPSSFQTEAPKVSADSDSSKFTNYPVALGVLSTVFFMWGFLTCLNDILIPHLKTVFELNYAQAMLIQFTFFGAYFLMSIPGGKIVSTLGYKKGIIAGLIVAAIGTFGFWPASLSHSYYVFLLALFVLATGITILQVAANPYVTLLGPTRTGSSRLNMAQALNSLGTTIAPYLGGLLILAGASSILPTNIGTAPETVQLLSTLNKDSTIVRSDPSQKVQMDQQIHDAIEQASPEAIVYALKNVPPYVYDDIPTDLLIEKSKNFTPALLSDVINSIPLDKKLAILSQQSQEKLAEIAPGAIVKAFDDFSTANLSVPDQTEQFAAMKTNLSASTKEAMQNYRNDQAKLVQIPYAGLGVILLLLALFVSVFKLPNMQEIIQGNRDEHYTLRDVFKHSHAVLGAIAIFFYVGGEVSIGSFMINYLTLPEIGRMTEQHASQYVALFWGGAMVGRIIGSGLMVKLSPRKILSLCAIVNIILLSTTMSTVGNTAVYSVVCIGLFNSIMFPTIFALGVEKMGPLTEQASSLIIMAIVGGAIIPFAQGIIADHIGLHHAFILPFICYLYILFYGLRGSKIKNPVITD